MQSIRSGTEILRSGKSLAVVAGMKKPNDHAEPTKVEGYKQNKKQLYFTSVAGMLKNGYDVCVWCLALWFL